MERAVREQAEGAARVQGERLTEQINRPAESIEAAAGEMERRSPLFRGTEASPQKEIFEGKTEPREPGEESTLYSNPLLPITQAYTRIRSTALEAGEALLQKAVGKLPESWRPG